MLRIMRSESDGSDGVAVVRLAGRVTGPWVDELRRVCGAVLESNGHGGRLVLDLAEVSFIDAEGVPLFRELLRRRVHVTNCSRFVEQQLKQVADGHDEQRD